MTTTSRLDPLYDFLLDADGTTYGDEFERRRWYEAVAMTSTLQSLAVPYALAASLLIWGRPAAPTVGVAALAVYLPLVLASLYARRHHLRYTAQLTSTRGIVLYALTIVPYLVIALDLLRLYSSGDTFSGALVGVPVGIAAALSFFVVTARRRAAWERSQDDA